VKRRFASIDVFVALVTAVGGILFGLSAYALLSTPNAREWGTLAVLALVASRFPLRVPGKNAWFSISDTFFMASALLFGPAPATVAIAIDSMLMSSAFKTWSLRRFLFNSGAPAIAFWAGAEVFFALAGTRPLFATPIPVDALVFPLGCFALVYFVLNSGLTALAISLEKQTPALAVWRSHFAVVSVNYFASASVAFLLVLLTAYLNVFALVAVIPLLAVINLAMRSWTGRLDDAEKHVATVDRLYLSTIEALSTAIEAKDGVTSSHIHRVQHYAMGLAGALGLKDPNTLKAIQAAALLHDTGKLAVPERILNKPGKLTDAEYETMKLHVDVGADILSSIDFPYPVVPIVRAHHENWDGSGYPRGLRGSDIPIGARILSVVDCYDALTSDRPYRAAMSDQQALAIIRARRGSMYDPAVVDVFEQVARDITPDVVTPQLQKALQQISRAVESAPAMAPPAAAATPVVEGPEALMALVNLARIVDDGPSVADVASVAWSQIRHIVPGASCSVFLTDAATDSIAARFVAGPASAVLQGLHMRIGERLSGWVAVNGQAIVNSEATLDLGQAAVIAGLSYCLAVPMQHGDRDAIGVLSVYSVEPFRDDQAQLIQSVGPYLAQMLGAASAHAESVSKGAPARGRANALRIVG
jgi:putative nucleotidyltransferase with HDIG domain